MVPLAAALSTLFLVTVAVTVSASTPFRAVPHDVQRAFYVGRSGDIVLKRPEEPSPCVMFFDPSRTYLAQQPDAPATHVTWDELTASVASLMGVPTDGPVSGCGPVSGNLFSRPQADIVFLVDGMDAEDASRLPALPAHAHLWSLSDVPYPMDRVATTVSLLTGASPAEHGIVGESWQGKRGKRTFAFESTSKSSSHPLKISLVDQLAHYHGGRSLTVSGSGSRALATAGGRVSPVGNLEVGHSTTVHLDRGKGFHIQHGSFPTLAASPSHMRDIFTTADFASLFDALGGGLVQYDKARDVWTVGAEEFDMGRTSDSVLFAELAYVHYMLRELASDPSLRALVEDATPDFFFFGFTGVKDLMDRHGSDSTKVSAASNLLGAALPVFVERLATLYKGKAAGQAVFVRRPKFDPSLIGVIHAVLGDHAGDKKKLHSDMPWVVLRHSLQGDDKDFLCMRLQEAVDARGWTVLCPADDPLDTRDFTSFLTVEEAVASSNNTHTDEEINRYQIILWTSILMSIAVLASVYTMAFMPMHKDTLLYAKVKEE